MKHLLFFFSFFLYFTSEAEAPRPRKTLETFCTFKEKRYNPGDSWHPYLEPHGFMFCIRCTCAETGHVNCNSIKCPVLQCENPVIDSQQCCPRCAAEPKSPVGLRAPLKSCQYNGTIYQAGEMFTSDELFPSRQPNQCVLCSCSNGNIFCGLRTCLKLTCSTPVSVPDTCCQLCKDHSDSPANPKYASMEEGEQLQLNRGVRHSQDRCSGEQIKTRAVRATPSTLSSTSRGINLKTFWHKGATGTTVKIVLQEKHRRACVYSGKTYSHGEVWHPVLRPHRLLECILCTCKDGKQECRKITCPSEYPCQYPEKPEGKCCKTCPETKEETNRTQCLQAYSNNLLVYKVASPSESDTDSTIRKIAIEREGAMDIEIYVWKTVEGILQLMEVQTLQKKEFAEQPENFILVTRLDEETWKKFREQEAKIKEATDSRMCDEGIKEVAKFLHPEELDRLCAA
ncbi:chordin-like protein 2 isoform X1 [Huso huso]|uniref:Chordin-like protein 2 isoform X1 n=1 Tax=Huso huso TaxID=61971 RepID=A0ABR0ZMI8_HUSHU